jgi:hypothetical protein
MRRELTHERIIDHFFFTEDIITIISFQVIIENYALPQLIIIIITIIIIIIINNNNNNNNTLILKMGCAPVNFADIVRVSLIMNFQGQWVGRKPTVWPSRSSHLNALGLLSLGLCQNQAYRQRVNTTLDELKAQIAAVALNVAKDMFQC